MKITLVAGARPNFMKIAPILKAIGENSDDTPIKYRLVHTGQHFDKKMSGDFFDQLNIPLPDVNLECGGGTQAEQTAAIMVKFEKELLNNKPDVVLVVGDVTSTMACTITARKLGIEVVHVEAGIRSGDWSMPEEINRVVTDSICNHFFTTSEQAGRNLINAAIPPGNIHFVGNTMIDTLLQNLDRLIKPAFWDSRKLKEKSYFLATLHRPSNVDDPENLTRLLNAIESSTQDYQIIFPVHPRTRQVLESINFNSEGITMIDPLPYLEFMYLTKYAKGIITDSGGITEEATVLNIPCITLRNSTERPETITLGTNELAGNNLDKLKHFIELIINDKWKSGTIPPLWDGKTSERIIDILQHLYSKKGLELAV